MIISSNQEVKEQDKSKSKKVKKNPSDKSQTDLQNHQTNSILNKQDELGNALRPKTLDDYIGQSRLKTQLKLIIDSAKIRGKMPEHLLFYGPPGLGKTTLASLISTEVKAGFKTLAAPSLQKIGDLVSLLLNLEENTVLFIDEIHRLKAPLEEILYSAMEDKQVDLVMGKGAAGSVAKIDLPNFTLVGATTQLGKLSKPLKDRFPSVFQLQPYEELEILSLIDRNTSLLGLQLTQSAAKFLASRCKGTPRIANNILKRMLDYQIVHNLQEIDLKSLQNFLYDLGVHELGLSGGDIKYLHALENGNLGVKTLAGMLMEEVDTLETVVEPYLIYLGLVDKTSLGRRITPKGRDYLGDISHKTLI